MENSNFKLQLIAVEALSNKYGFCPAPQQVILLESDVEGTYILFRIGGHEYRCDDGEITNIEEQKKLQKKLDEENNVFLECLKIRQRDLDDLREQMEKQEKLFATKELMLTEAYNAKRAEMETLKGQIRFLETLADDRKKEIERLETKNSEMKKTLHYRDMALDKAAAKRNDPKPAAESEEKDDRPEPQ